MKTGFYAISLLALSMSALAQTPERTAYQAICPSKNNTTEALSNGQEVQYLCSVKYSSTRFLDEADTPDTASCIENCQALKGCAGGYWLWSSRSCKLFTAGNEAIEPQRGSVVFHLISTEDTSTATGQCFALEHSLADCEAVEMELFQALDQLQNKTQGLEQDLEAMEKNLEDCQKGSGSSGGDGPLNWPEPNQWAINEIGGQRFQLRTGGLVYGYSTDFPEVSTKFGLTYGGRILSPYKCFQECTQRPECLYAHWGFNACVLSKKNATGVFSAGQWMAMRKLKEV